jgi:predicted nuclease of predicted toxin-antitoxin system
VKLLVDHQLPPALARMISGELGAEAVHVRDLGLRSATDAELWRHAADTGSVLISKDEDFVSLCVTVPEARLLWVRLGNCRREFLLATFRAQWHRIQARFDAGDRLVELR